MRRLAMALAGAAVATLGAAAAETYPSRPITVIVPFPAGGPTDAIVRVLGERMRVSLGQPMVVEYVTGASGTIGLARAARAAPDGYTVIFGHWGTHVMSGAVFPLTFDLVRDFAPVSLLPSNPYVLVSKAAVPAGNLQELVAWLKANADKASQATPGVNTGPHLFGQMLQQRTGARF